MKTKSILLALTLALCISTSACFGGNSLVAGFRIAFAASAPFVDSLVASGVISQDKANLVLQDINDGIKVAETGEVCIKDIPADVAGGAKNVAKGKCYLGIAINLRVILDRHNIGGNDQLNRIATIARGAIAAFEAYYKSVSGSKMGDMSASVDSDPDETLKEKLKQIKKDLEAATKH